MNKPQQKGVIKAQFETELAAAATVLDRARICAQLTKAWILPPLGHTENDRLPLNHQSVGSRGLTNLEGKMLLALFPPSIPWFNLKVPADVMQDPNIPDEAKQGMKAGLFLREVAMLSMLESSDTSGDNAYSPNTFRSTKRAVLSQLACTGDVLEQLTDGYRLKMFRRDQYTTKRSSDGQVMWHCIKEQVDAMSLSDEELAQAGLTIAQVEAEPVDKRVKDLYTRVAWNPRKKLWIIEQEFEGVIIRTSEDRISPYFCTSYERMGTDNYGRGIIEMELGDLSGLETLETRLLDLMGLAAKGLIVNDPNSGIRDSDLTKPSGSVIQGLVDSQGKAKGIGMVSFALQREFQILDLAIDRKTTSLSKAFLMESELQPQKERVTAAQINRIAQELDGALGGVYAPISEEQQLPLLMRLEFQMQRDGLLLPLPDGTVKVQTVTGIEALGRAQQTDKLMGFAQILGSLGDVAMARLDIGVLVDVLARYYGIQEPGLIKTEKKVQEEQQAAMEQAMKAQAATKAIDTLGNVAEANATQPPQGPPV